MSDTNETATDPVAAMMDAELRDREGKERWWGLSDFTPEVPQTEEEDQEARRLLGKAVIHRREGGWVKEGRLVGHLTDCRRVRTCGGDPCDCSLWIEDKWADDRDGYSSIEHTAYEVECMDNGTSCGCGYVVDGVVK